MTLYIIHYFCDSRSAVTRIWLVFSFLKYKGSMYSNINVSSKHTVEDGLMRTGRAQRFEGSRSEPSWYYCLERRSVLDSFVNLVYKASCLLWSVTLLNMICWWMCSCILGSIGWVRAPPTNMKLLTDDKWDADNPYIYIYILVFNLSRKKAMVFIDTRGRSIKGLEWKKKKYKEGKRTIGEQTVVWQQTTYWRHAGRVWVLCLLCSDYPDIDT